jgi:hypothetical protein
MHRHIGTTGVVIFTRKAKALRFRYGEATNKCILTFNGILYYITGMLGSLQCSSYKILFKVYMYWFRYHIESA